MALVLVEAVSLFRIRYLVETPDDKPEWALDTVAMNEANEFSQKHLDEVISSTRIISEEEALALFDIDNPEAASWDNETKKLNAFTFLNDK